MLSAYLSGYGSMTTATLFGDGPRTAPGSAPGRGPSCVTSRTQKRSLAPTVASSPGSALLHGEPINPEMLVEIEVDAVIMDR